MNQQQTMLLIFAGVLGVAGFAFGWPRLSETQRSLSIDLVNMGLVGTAIGVPLGLWAIPRFHDSAWKAAAILTAASLGTKIVLMHHESVHEATDELADDVGMGELVAVYR